MPKQYIKKKERAMMREEAQVKDEIDTELMENSEESFDHDLEEFKRHREEEGSITPEDLFAYKVFRIQPDSKKEFEGLIDKDITLAKYSGKPPALDYLAFVAETITLINNILVVNKQFKMVDEDNNIIVGNDGKPVIVTKKVPDDFFAPVTETLRNSLKFNSVGSRALGNDREAILDKTILMTKGIVKKGSEKKNRLIGMGGSGE